MAELKQYYGSEQPEQATDFQLRWLQVACLLDRCSQQWSEILRECADLHDLSERQVLILWHCSTDRAGSSQIELARQLAVSPAQLSQLLEQLRERGLLESVRDPNDRRRQRSLLTKVGSNVWMLCRTELQESLACENQALSAEQLDQLGALLITALQPPGSPPALAVVSESLESTPSRREAC